MCSYGFRTGSAMKALCCHQRFLNSSCTPIPLKLPSCTETHFWYVLPDEVKSRSLLNQYLELLSPCEKEAALRMQGEELQKRAILARTLVRTTIARYQMNSQVNARSLKFRKNIHGKPEVDWQYMDDWKPPPLHFNLSHTSSMIACGVTTSCPIGIDVEEKQRTIKSNVLSFARRYFTQHEVDLLVAIGDPETRREEFLKLWTLKEAFVKALGTGFSASPFKTFTILSKADGTSNSEVSEIVVDVSKDPNLKGNWQFTLLELAGSHYAAICRNNHAEGDHSTPMKLTVWKTIPLVEDLCVSGTSAVLRINRLVQ